MQWYRKPDYTEKITDLQQFTDKLYHAPKLTSTHASTTYQSNHHAITTVTEDCVLLKQFVSYRMARTSKCSMR